MRDNKEPDPAFAALLRAVADDPEDDTSVLVAADWIDEHAPPLPVPDRYAGRLPGWFTTGWRANVPGSGARFVDQEIQNLRIPGADFHVIDHWGCGYVRGVFCLVSEPYLDAARTAEAILAAREIARLCGGVGLFGRESSWNPPRTKRLIWAPHPDLLPRLTRHDLSARRR